MKINKQSKSLAKEVVRSAKKNGELDESVIKRFTSILIKSEKPFAREVLTEIKNILAAEERNTTLIIESAYLLSQESQEKLRNYFEEQAGKKLNLKFIENKAIVGGVRIRLGDFIWEHSVMSNLENLKGVLTYE